jgi:hypothetical protein
MIPNFNIENNLLVEFLLPDEDGSSFILGISLLGGDDVLGGFDEFTINLSLIGGNDVLAPSSGLKWQDVGCETSQGWPKPWRELLPTQSTSSRNQARPP